MTREPIDEARVWMGKLSREDFDKLLLLTDESHRRGAREAIEKAVLVAKNFEQDCSDSISHAPLPISPANLKSNKEAMCRDIAQFIGRLNEEYPR